MANIYIRTFDSAATPGVYDKIGTAQGADTTLQNGPYPDNSIGEYQFFYNYPGSGGNIGGGFGSGVITEPVVGSTIRIYNQAGEEPVRFTINPGIVTNFQQVELFPDITNSGTAGGMLVWLVTVKLNQGNSVVINSNFLYPNALDAGVGGVAAGGGEMFTYAAIDKIEIQPPAINFPYYSNTIVIDSISTSWLDEVYASLWSGPNQTNPIIDPLTGSQVQVCIDPGAGAGIFWPVSQGDFKCIDPSTVYDPNGDPALWPFGTQDWYYANDLTQLAEWPQGVFPSFFSMQTGLVAGSQNDGPVQQSSLPLTFSIAPNLNLFQVFLQTPQDLSLAHTLEFKTDGVLKFDINRLVTGINIVDDMLFWTDNFTEPKKVNIPRSLAGTLPDGSTHTFLYTNELTIDHVKEEHITVVRKSPQKSPSLKMTTTLRDGVVDGELLVTNNNVLFNDNLDGVIDFAINDISQNEKPDFLIGDVLRLAVDLVDLPSQYELRVSIVNIDESTSGETTYSVRIMSISDSAPVNSPQTWYVALEETGSNLFERKFPRFAYRYKYVDNEYSTFSPFTNAAFKPGNFNYEPVKAYNEGMTNTVKTLVIQDFITKDIPKDVVQVDLLYKNETSPNIYLMDSIRKDDTVVPGASANIWNSQGSSNHYNAPKGSYSVNTENIYSTLPSNQSLRSWDNVPRKALAQEITGNRIVYGNYTQGYNIKEIENQSNQLTPDLSITVRGRGRESNKEAMPSIKSLRNYDIGVVWGDKYGRETPVITPSSGSIVVPKNKSSQSSYFATELRNAPYWADYYRFYIKETSNEYYNLPVDRIYDAEDGNIWVSFPSVDRNKVDEDTYIVLKKGADNDEAIIDEARYKIIAIENNAPDFIKTVYEPLARTNTDGSRPLQSCNMFNGSVNAAGVCSILPNPLTSGNFPTVNRKNFTLNYSHWTKPYDISNAHQGLKNIKDLYESTSLGGLSKLFVSFSKETVNANGDATVVTGSKYEVVGITMFDDADVEVQNTFATGGGTAPIMSHYDIKLATPILSTDEFITSGYSSAGAVLVSDANGGDNIHVLFWKESVENKPEFDGRFFVKIHSDSLDRQRFSTEPAGDRKWIVSSATSLYKIDDTTIADDMGDYNYNSTQVSTGISWAGTINTNLDYRNPSSLTRTKTQWDNALSFGSSVIDGRWFIDKASFASIVPANENRYFSIDPDYGHYWWRTQNNNDPVLINNTITSTKFETPVEGVWNSSDIQTTQSWGVSGQYLLNSLPHDHCFTNATYTNNYTWVDGSPTGTGNFSSGFPIPVSGWIQAELFWDAMFIGARLDMVDKYNLPNAWVNNPSLFDTEGRDIGDGLSNGIIGMKGVWNDGNNNYIDIAYSKLSPDSEGATHCNNIGRNEFYDVNWGVGVGASNTATSAEDAIVANLAPNKRFKLVGSSAIFKIIGVTKKRLFNFLGVKTSYMPTFDLDAGSSSVGAAGRYWNENHIEQQKLMGLAQNRRHSYRIEYELDINASPNGTDVNLKIDTTGQPYDNITNLADTTVLSQVANTIEFLEEYDEGVNKISKNPAIFETEPKEDADLELYYEASSSIPINSLLTNENKFDYIPIGSTLVSPVNFNNIVEGIFVTGWNEFDEGTINPITGVFPTVSLSVPLTVAQQTAYGDQGYYSFLKDDGSIVISPTGPFSALGVGGGNIVPTNSPEVIVEKSELIGLSWHNCWSFGNGVESNRIGDTYNKPFIQNGVTLSSIIEEDFKEENRSSGLIYSGLYNSSSGINNLNQFIQAEKITKDINPTYGSIQKLYSKQSADGDLITLCEDRVLKILANKDALFNADGNPQLISTDRVLGQAVPYSGSYGISKNPESFAGHSYRAYFADKVRGSIVRLSRDGLTAISDHGMRDWFRDNLKLSNDLIGSYDNKKDEYNITSISIDATTYPSTTVTFREDAKGWVSFKSFIPENAISCANEYYSFQGGNLWKHHDETVDRNTFYNTFTPTSLNVIMNDMPSVVKTFHTLNYEGSQSNVNARTNYDTYDITSWNGTFHLDTGLPVYTAITGNNFDNNYYNLENKAGWYVESIATNKEEGSIKEFIEKEGKWFNYIKGKR